jgi:hypothetical protein
VKSKGAFYDGMALGVEPFVEAGGPAAARAARFLSTALNLAFREKLLKQQHALFEFATAIAEVETAVALVRAAALTHDPLLEAQGRVWASEVALSVPVRLLKLFSASGVLTPAAFAEFSASADCAGAVAAQAGRLADMDDIAAAITGR